MTTQTGGGRVVTNMSLSVAGHDARENALDMSWVIPFAVSDVARDHLISLPCPPRCGTSSARLRTRTRR